jgi:DNA-binding CsgD family transcriptional regulator
LVTASSNAHGAILRPIERRVRRLSGDGVSTDEIARRFRRRPETIERVREMSELRKRDGGTPLRGDVLTPIERRVLRWRAEGVGHDDIAAKFQRSGRFIRQVERLAFHRLGAD